MKHNFELISGTDFTMGFTALRDDIDLPDPLPEIIPDDFLADLSDFEMTVQLSTTEKGKKVVAATDEQGAIELRRLDKSNFVLEVPNSVKLSEGHMVVTIQFRHRETGCIVAGQEETVFVRRIRDIK